MAFETEGILYKVFETENKTASFQAREFVIKHEGDYPQLIKFQLTQDRCDLIQKYETGQKIKVHFDLRGREWNDKFFTNLNAWRIENATDTGNTDDNTGAVESFSPLGNDFENAEGTNEMTAEDFGDLPF
jgi:hypothetical protein